MLRELNNSKGFSLLEAMVSLALISVAMAGVLSQFKSYSKVASRDGYDEEARYLKDVTNAQMGKFLSNYLFWITNVPNGCTGAGDLFHGIDPKTGAQNAHINSDLVVHRFPGKHRISLLTDLTPSASTPTKSALIQWYSTADKGKDPIAKTITNCTASAQMIKPGKDLSGISRFEFCLLVESDVSPAIKKARANANPVMPNGFFIAHYEATLYDIAKETEIPCSNDYWTVYDNLNRGIQVRSTMHSISRLGQKPSEQVRASTTGSMFNGKLARMLINCSNLQRKLDPVFKYVCGG